MVTAQTALDKSLGQRCADASCRSCGRSGLQPVLDLGQMPLTSGFLTREKLEQPEKRYPLSVAICPDCALFQILETVPPEEMFRSDYPYYSSYSKYWLGHCRELAEEIIPMLGLNEKSFVIELASNDGCFLRNFVPHRIPCLGIDPAEDPAAVARSLGVPTICRFFDRDLAGEVRREYPPANLVVGMNVLGHVAKVHSFIEGIKLLLAEDGVVLFEFPYVRDLVERTEFDTIYHEHLGYFSVTSVQRLLRSHGLYVTRVQRLPSHGGSLRVYARLQDRPDDTVAALLEEERKAGMLEHAFYDQLRVRTERYKEQINCLLRDLRAQGKRVAAYGAAAKGVILLHYAGIDTSLVDWVADLNVHKQGMYLPGAHLPVCAPSRVLEEKPDYLLILPWNISEEIMAQHAEYKAGGGKFIIPIPEVRVV